MPRSATPRVLAVIPARGGSKGLPRKNVSMLAGLPLIGHSLAAAERMPWITRCVVSTDDDEIAAVAARLGGDVPFRRPSALGGDDTPMAPVLSHALRQIEDAEQHSYDFLVLLDPTSPVRDLDKIAEAFELLRERPAWDGVISVSAPEFHPVWVGVRAGADGTLQRYFDAGAGITRRQELDRYLRINGAFYIWRTGFVRQMPAAWFDEGRHGMVEIPEPQAYAIDYPYQLAELAALIDAGVISLPWIAAENS